MIDRRQILRAGLATGATLVIGPSASSAAYGVRNQQELDEALKKCRGGEMIEVMSPLVGATIMNARFPADRPVTIRGTFRSPPRTDMKIHPALEVFSSAGIRFDDCDFEGYVRGRFDRWGRILFIHDSADISVDKCRIGKGWQGVWAYSCERLSFTDCDIADIGPFGMQFTRIRGFKCQRTAIHGFNIFVPPDNLSAGEHGDAIMFQMVPRWSPDSAWAEEGSSDILIEDVFVLGDPDNKPQGFFFLDVPKVGGRYDRVTLRNNDLWGTMWNGIAMDSLGENVILQNNRVRCLREVGRPVAGGDIRESNININSGGTPPVLIGNSASTLQLNGKLVGHRGVREGGRVPYAQAQAAFAAWQAARSAGSLPSQLTG
jgi:hypothetical protein